MIFMWLPLYAELAVFTALSFWCAREPEPKR